MALEYINQPFKIGHLALKNRFVMPPMVTDCGTADGLMTEKQIAYYAARAEGGVGLIIVELTAVTPEGKGSRHGLCLHDDSCIPPLTELTRIAHSHGAKILIQLAHAGRQTISRVTGLQPVAPSAIASLAIGEVPRELTIEEIKLIQMQFSHAARRAIKAGFDGVEIHGAHGYLVHQFLSPGSNKRTDRYGGDCDGRSRFLIEILDGVRKVVPSDFVVGCRLNGEDYLEDGLHIEDTKQTAMPLVRHGVSYLHISCGTHESSHMTIPPMDVQPGFLAHLAEAVKKTVSVPVITVGRFVDPIEADIAIGEGKADLVAMGRALWADPDLPRKAMEHRLREIRPCIGCNQGCRRKTERCCTMNPVNLREMELTIIPSKQPKRVMVIGGGPAGLEAACVAKKRGHFVRVIEKSSQLGGNFRLAAMPPHRGDIEKGIRFFKNELTRLNVPVSLGETATRKSIEAYTPDEVILATGAVPLRPAIPGIEQDKVLSAEEVLEGRDLAAKRVLVIGGGLVGSEVADFLSGKGKEVVLVEMLSDIGLERDVPSTFFLRQRLQKQKVDIWQSSKVTEIRGDTVIVNHRGKEKSIERIDAVVFAVGYKSSVELAEEMKCASFGVHIIGDALEPRDALAAILEGSKVARAI